MRATIHASDAIGVAAALALGAGAGGGAVDVRGPDRRRQRPGRLRLSDRRGLHARLVRPHQASRSRSRARTSTSRSASTSNLEDPWGMGVGFAVQMVFVFIDNARGRPHRRPARPERRSSPRARLGQGASSCRRRPRRASSRRSRPRPARWPTDIVVPSRAPRGRGRTISGAVKLADLGEGDPVDLGLPGGDAVQRGLPGRQAIC